MKYQALKRLKTKTKVLKICDSLAEAHKIISEDGGKFVEFSYMGGFPVYLNEKNQAYNIQGLHEQLNIVLGIDKELLSAFNFQN